MELSRQLYRGTGFGVHGHETVVARPQDLTYEVDSWVLGEGHADPPLDCRVTTDHVLYSSKKGWGWTPSAKENSFTP